MAKVLNLFQQHFPYHEENSEKEQQTGCQVRPTHSEHAQIQRERIPTVGQTVQDEPVHNL